MAIPSHVNANFDTLQAAGDNGDLAVMECTERETGETLYIVCAVYVDDDGMYNMVPLAQMFTENPYEKITPPGPEVAAG